MLGIKGDFDIEYEKLNKKAKKTPEDFLRINKKTIEEARQECSNKMKKLMKEYHANGYNVGRISIREKKVYFFLASTDGSYISIYWLWDNPNSITEEVYAYDEEQIKEELEYLRKN